LYLAIILSGIFSLALTYIITGIIRKYALKKDMLDIPNERSSHKTPTPRGGGLSIVISTLLFSAILWHLNCLHEDLLYAIIVGAALVAGIGFIDDHGHVSAKIRFAIHIIASVLMLYIFDWLPEVTILGKTIEPGIAGNALAVFFLVWLINLTNFMDGIDGLATLQAVAVFAFLSLILKVTGNTMMLSGAVVLTGASLGFLLWNWPPAKIFMGDVASGFLGYMFGVFLIIMLRGSSFDGNSLNGLISFLIIMGIFIVDSTFTLVRRMINGKKWYNPHRTHGYQKASDKYGHKRVTVTFGIINIFCLAPAAYVGWYNLKYGLILCTCSYICLIIMAYKIQAGDEED
jgi:Fuc2NAc and GlcNAc transferase